MALVKHGDSGIFIQPNRTISEKDDGTLSGSVIYEASEGAYLPGLGFSHPDDGRLEMIEQTITHMPNGKKQLQASYFGIVASTTIKKISYTGAQNQDAIETHANFGYFAGNGSVPINGAQFITEENADGDEYYEFQGFFPFANGGGYNAFTGVSSYLTAGTQVSVTYWTDKIPKLDNRMTIVQFIPGFTTPPDVGNFLLLDTPYREVGSFYQVTEQYLGSGQRGWNSDIYRYF
jgi:hypothetical protein